MHRRSKGLDIGSRALGALRRIGSRMLGDPVERQPNRPFHLTRWRLAIWYTSVMSLIFILAGLVIYRLIVHTRWLNLQQEMRDMAALIEDTIEPALTEPGTFDPIASSLLPGLCQIQQVCLEPSKVALDQFQLEQQVASLEDNAYCIRFLNLDRVPIASIQFPSHHPVCRQPVFWQQLHDGQGHYYHRKSYALHTASGSSWGTLQIARSLNDVDLYLWWIELALGGIILLAIALVGGSSWWLAGLAMRPVRQSYQQMQQFTADAAHELRTPLTALQAMVQAALRTDALSPAEAREVLHTVNRQSHRLSRLVQDLLLLCQMDQSDQQRSETTFHPCCLNTMMQELVDEFMALAIAADLTLSASLEMPELIYVLGNGEQLYRAIANLISNAIQYTPAGGEITLTLSCDALYAIVQVQDTGVGIPLDEQERIFDRFYRVERERSRHRGGSGLGLAITQAVVHTHQGSCKVYSELGKGSVFILQFPLWMVSGS